jgi:arylsulfatase A-like enzyme
MKAALLAPLAALTASGATKQNTNIAENKGNAGYNFLFILIDDLGWKDLGCYGSTFYETPHIDRLAATGMRFTRAYAAAPVCSPTRSSIMTGKYPARTKNTDYFGGPQPDGYKGNTRLVPPVHLPRLDAAETTLAEAFKEGGYTTFFAGKWHLGPEGSWPEDHGFDINKGGWRSGGPYGGEKYFSPYGNPRLKDGPPGEHLPDRLATETVNFMASSKDKPFLAYLSFYSVHTPLISRPDLRRKYEEKRARLGLETQWGREREREVRLTQDHAVYAGMVEAMDEAVGKVLEGLDRLGLADNTIVFFMSDNGGLSTSEGHPTSVLPLRGGKGWIYEGGVREPMIVRWPGVTAAGSVSDGIVTSTDFYPTLLDMAGLPARPEQTVDGVSLVPLLKGRSPGRGPIYCHYPHYGNQGGAPSGAVWEGDWKLIEWYEDMRVELYNLKDDPGERTDLSVENPQKAAELRRCLQEWRVEVDALMPAVNTPYFSTLTWDGGASDRRIDRAENWNPNANLLTHSVNSAVVNGSYATTYGNNFALGYHITYNNTSSLAWDNAGPFGRMFLARGAAFTFNDSSSLAVHERLYIGGTGTGALTLTGNATATAGSGLIFGWGGASGMEFPGSLMLRGNSSFTTAGVMQWQQATGQPTLTHTITLADSATLTVNNTTVSSLKGALLVVNFEQADNRYTPIWTLGEAADFNQADIEYRINGGKTTLADPRFVQEGTSLSLAGKLPSE